MRIRLVGLLPERQLIANRQPTVPQLMASGASNPGYNCNLRLAQPNGANHAPTRTLLSRTRGSVIANEGWAWF